MARVTRYKDSMTIPTTMTAIAVREPGGPEVLVPEIRPVPDFGAEELLVKVHAAGVNGPDLLQRQGKYRPPPGVTDIPGLEIAGEVIARGASVTRFDIGDTVVALVPGGGYAEYCRADAAVALPAPKALSIVEAAAVPENFFTVWSNLFERGRLRPGEAVLVHGGASGIGMTAIQLGKAFGATVFVTAGSAAKCAACEALGADLAINYHEDDFVERVKQATGGRGVDVILDMVGGDYTPRNYDAIAEDGRVIQIAFQRGAKAEINLWKMQAKRITHTGSTLRSRPVAFKAVLAATVHEKVWPLLEARAIVPPIDSTFSLAEAPKAHARMAVVDRIGRVVLTVAK